MGYFSKRAASPNFVIGPGELHYMGKDSAGRRTFTGRGFRAKQLLSDDPLNPIVLGIKATDGYAEQILEALLHLYASANGDPLAAIGFIATVDAQYEFGLGNMAVSPAVAGARKIPEQRGERTVYRHPRTESKN